MKTQHRKFREMEAMQNDKASLLEIKLHDKEQETNTMIDKYESKIRSIENEMQDYIMELEKERSEFNKLSQKLDKSY